MVKYIFILEKTQPIVFPVDKFDQLKSEEAGSRVKTARPKFNELKMQAVFTRKNRLSDFYVRKFLPSYTTSRDGIARNDKCRSQTHRP